MARRWLEDAGHGEHEVALGDGGCWSLWERRNENGPREWKLSAVKPDGNRLRLHIALEIGDEAVEWCARRLEGATTWTLNNEWPRYAEDIETCRDVGDAGEVECFGAAIH